VLVVTVAATGLVVSTASRELNQLTPNKIPYQDLVIKKMQDLVVIMKPDLAIFWSDFEINLVKILKVLLRIMSDLIGMIKPYLDRIGKIKPVSIMAILVKLQHDFYMIISNV